MATIKTARGIKANMPSLLENGQQYFCTDTDELYIGRAYGNSLLSSPEWSVHQEYKKYAELVALVGNLKAGCQYVLTDYRTKYQQPVTGVIKTATKVERLVLTAISHNAFDIHCSSLNFPQDEILYDFNNNLCEDGTTPRNGFILRRNDTIKKINCPHDWRTILFARFLLDATKYTVWTAGVDVIQNKYYLTHGPDGEKNLVITINHGIPSSWDDINYFVTVIPNYETNYVLADNNLDVKADKTKMKEYLMVDPEFMDNVEIGDSTKFPLSNNVIKKPLVINYNSCNIILGNECYNNTFGDENTTQINNKIIFHQNCSDNIIFGSINLNFRDTFCNIFGSSCGSLTIMGGISNIANNASDIISDGANIIIGDRSNHIKIYSCRDNFIGPNCREISIGAYSNNNTIGSNCRDLDIGNYCTSNVFGSNLCNISVEHCSMVHNNISAITDLQNSKGNIRIQTNVDGRAVYMKLDANNVPVYTVIP